MTIKEVPIRKNLSDPLSISNGSWGFGIIKCLGASNNLVNRRSGLWLRQGRVCHTPTRK